MRQYALTKATNLKHYRLKQDYCSVY